MNTSSYFPHNNNARNDEKIIGVRMDFGCEGYGIFFMLLERLGESEDYTCAADYKRIAFEFHCQESTVEAIVKNYGLFCFTEDGSRFYSQGYNERMQIRDERRKELSAQRAEAGRIGAEKRWNNSKRIANAINYDGKSMANAITDMANANENIANDGNKSKVNKSKENNIKESIKENAAVAATLTQEQTPKEIPKLTPKQVAEDRKKRAKTFYDSLIPFVDVYGAEMVRAFYDYWTEPNKSGTKMRFEMQPTWDTKRRISTWSKNEDNYNQRNNKNNGNNNHTPTPPVADTPERKPYSRIQELGRTRFNLE